MDRTTERHPGERLVGTAPAIQTLRAQIRRLAAFDQVGGSMVPTLLVQGETGTGKGLVARIIHDSGPRAQGPFIPVNCAAIPATMLEAELFGFEAGAFTDAKRPKPGLFEAASGGTLFLDEIDALAVPLQSKLLTAIESKRVRRLAALAERAVDVKLIAATQVDLAGAVAAGRFREDLYHRLAVLVLALPPLRERGEDVVQLARTFLHQLATGYGVEPKILTDGAEAWLRAHRWPGNIRELGHVMERITLLHPDRHVTAPALAALSPEAPVPAAPAAAGPEPPAPPLAGDEAEQIRDALERAEGNVVRAARLLGVSRDTVRWRMKRHGLGRPARERSGARPGPASPARTPGAGGPRGHAAPTEAPTETPSGPADTRAPAWEQKTVAVLAIELTWAASAGSEMPRYEVWTEAARWERSIIEKITGFGGVRLQKSPSLDLWVFGLPRALDQLSERAVQAALTLRQEMVGLSADRRPEVRMALHLGAALVDTDAQDPLAQVLPVGETLALPIRLLADCEPGDILASFELGHRLGDWLALDVRELRSRSGSARARQGYVVRGVSPGRERRQREAGRVLGQFVGRARELSILHELLAQVVGGAGQVVGIAGEPGSGKSRLLAEFRRSLPSRQVTYGEGHCLAYSSLTPYFPLIELMRDFFRAAETDAPETVAARVRRRLQALDPAAEADAPYLLQAMGAPGLTDRLAAIDPGTLKGRTFDALRQILFLLSRRQPLVLALENVHWIDPTSEAFLLSVTEHLAGARVMLLMTYRPGYQPPWLTKACATQISLPPLGAGDSRQILRAVMGDTPRAADVENEILAKAEGNPLFLEELARSLVEHGDRATELAIPETIHAVLEARIDRLAPADRRLLQTAAVIGRDVPLAWLQPIAGLSDEAFQAGLARLQTAEFFYETRRAPERVHTFKHALTQVVAYETLNPPQRRALHRAVLDGAGALASEPRADQVGQLAHHAVQAEAWDLAVGYLRQAGRAAAERAAHREAARCWERALVAVGHLPGDRDSLEAEADVRFNLAHSLYSSGDFDHALEEYGRAQAAAERLGDPRQLALVSAGLTYLLGSRGDHAGAIAAGERAMAIASSLGDVPLQVWTSVSLGREYFAQGEYRRGIERTLPTVEVLKATPVGRRFRPGLLPAVGARTWLALCHGRRGEFPEAIGWGNDAVRIADELGSPQERLWAYYCFARIHLGRGHFDAGLPWLERALPLCEDGRFPLYAPRVLSSLGVAYAQTGRLDAALPLLERAVDEAQAIRLLYGHVMVLTQLGDAYLEAGRLDEAGRLADQALRLAQAHGERGDEAWVLHLVAGIDAGRSPADTERASGGFGAALALAETLEMRPLQARCHLALGTLRRDVDQPAAARGHLERAVMLFREMAMGRWLAPAEALLAEVAAPSG
jgi:DNA-binding NtrC family response regulator/tetratricopeptide (TPR) repeat protein